MKIHIGTEIAKIQKLRGLPNEELASKISTSVRNLNNIKLKEDLMLSQLYAISEALDYNFFKLFDPVVIEPNHVLKEDAIKYGKKGKMHTIKFEVQYPTELSPELGKFMMHVDAIADKIGFQIV